MKEADDKGKLGRKIVFGSGFPIAIDLPTFLKRFCRYYRLSAE